MSTRGHLARLAGVAGEVASWAWREARTRAVEAARRVLAPRPKVGPWIDLIGLDGSNVYDERGMYVACVSILRRVAIADRWTWCANRPRMPVQYGEERTKAEAQRRARDVLATWADVSAIDGKGQ